MDRPKSASTLLELKHILEKNAWHDGVYAALFFLSSVTAVLFGCNRCFIMGMGVVSMFLLGMVANLIFARATEIGHLSDKIREWCGTKAVAYFLMLHYHTSDRVRVVLQHLEMGEELRMEKSESISFKSVTELELMKIVSDNMLHLFRYSFSWLILGYVALLNYYAGRSGIDWCILCIIISVSIICIAAVDGVIAMAIEIGYGGITPKWCTTKAVRYFLMLHYHTRGRARLVLEKMEDERTNTLQRMEDERRRDAKIGEIISFKKGPYVLNNGDCCIICLGEYKVSERVRIVRKCNHCFHADCFQRWLRNKKETCPICRVPLL